MTGGLGIAGVMQVGAAADEEPTLWAQCADGDPAAFARLVSTHQDGVARLAYRLLGWSGDVEDVVQDVFLAAWTHRRKFRGDCRLSTWLVRVTVNQCRKRSRLRWLRAIRDATEHEQRQASQYADQGNFDATATLRDAVRRLPASYREVVVLRYLEDLPVERITEVLGLRANTVNVRLMRARQKLRERLGDNYMQEGAL